MKLNPRVSELFQLIGSESVKLANSPCKSYSYNRRLMKIFMEQLTDEERIYVITAMFEMAHYRSVMTDENHIQRLQDGKHKTIFLVFLLSCVFTVVVGMVFKTNDDLNGITAIIGNLFRMFSLGG
ncbi:MAG: hypothetical protein PHN51_11605 [Candidatus Nanopelagicales bacterium]|nr:hypothetical protein [Candidatus Nanopelagicales bacterium]